MAHLQGGLGQGASGASVDVARPAVKAVVPVFWVQPANSPVPARFLDLFRGVWVCVTI